MTTMKQLNLNKNNSYH